MTLSLTQVFRVRMTVADRLALVRMAKRKKVSASALVRALIQSATGAK